MPATGMRARFRLSGTKGTQQSGDDIGRGQHDESGVQPAAEAGQTPRTSNRPARITMDATRSTCQ